MHLSGRRWSPGGSALGRRETFQSSYFEFPEAISDWCLMPPRALDPDDDLLTPREVAEMFGVRASTVAMWARVGSLKPAVRTPGGHRRYRRTDVLVFRDGYKPDDSPEQEQEKRDLVRLYEQGWSIRRVAEEFGFSYGKTRRILSARTSLRNR